MSRYVLSVINYVCLDKFLNLLQVSLLSILTAKERQREGAHREANINSNTVATKLMNYSGKLKQANIETFSSTPLHFTRF